MEDRIKDLIKTGYLDAVKVAELNEVPIPDFRLWASQAVLGIFLSINEIGMDQVSPQGRAEAFKQSLDGFYEHARVMYAEHLSQEVRPRRELRSIESGNNFDRNRR